jgi:hypothetical protein
MLVCLLHASLHNQNLPTYLKTTLTSTQSIYFAPKMSKNVPSCRNPDQYSDSPDPSIASKKKTNTTKIPIFVVIFWTTSYSFVTMPTLITAQATTNAGEDCEFEQQQQQPPLLPTHIHNPYDTTTSTMGPQSQQNNGSISKKCCKAASTYTRHGLDDPHL